MTLVSSVVWEIVGGGQKWPPPGRSCDQNQRGRASVNSTCISSMLLVVAGICHFVIISMMLNVHNDTGKCSLKSSEQYLIMFNACLHIYFDLLSDIDYFVLL